MGIIDNKMYLCILNKMVMKRDCYYNLLIITPPQPTHNSVQ